MLAAHLRATRDWLTKVDLGPVFTDMTMFAVLAEFLSVQLRSHKFNLGFGNGTLIVAGLNLATWLAGGVLLTWWIAYVLARSLEASLSDTPGRRPLAPTEGRPKVYERSTLLGPRSAPAAFAEAGPKGRTQRGAGSVRRSGRQPMHEWHARWAQRRSLVVLLGLTLVVASGCTAASGLGNIPRPAGAPAASSPTGGPRTSARPRPHSRRVKVDPPFRDLLPGMPPAVGNDVYGATRAGMLSAVVARDPSYLYVPDSQGATVTIISQTTHKILRVLRTGQLSQHVSPSYDLKTLYTDASAANKLISINPRTSRLTKAIAVPRPYNIYFTPDGKQSVIMVEEHNRILFAKPRSFQGFGGLTVPGCRGPNHADFSANGRYFIVTCEFSGALVKISTTDHRVLGILHLGKVSMPQDIRISPHGTVFYVADMGSDQVRVIDGSRFRQVAALAMPAGPHGLYPSRNAKLLYVSDRAAGKVSVVSFATNRIVSTWTIPGGGSPDMGGVSADGKTLWLTGRYDGEVYGFNTATGRLIARIKVGGNPHGMAVWPQPGRYSLGHTGNMR